MKGWLLGWGLCRERLPPQAHPAPSSSSSSLPPPYLVTAEPAVPPPPSLARTHSGVTAWVPRNGAQNGAQPGRTGGADRAEGAARGQARGCQTLTCTPPGGAPTLLPQG